MKTIVFAIQKGGQGKSMLATHFAFYAAESKHSVLAVDLDGQGNFSRNLTTETIDKEVSPALSLFEGRMRPALPLSGKYIAPGRVALFSGDHRLVRVDEVPKLLPGSLRDSLQSVAASFDICVIDPPPTLGKRLRAALMAADYVVMPFAPARESVDAHQCSWDRCGRARAPARAADYRRVLSRLCAAKGHPQERHRGARQCHDRPDSYG